MAMLLARAGHRVLVVDRATFPSDTLSTHFLHGPAIARLIRWGLLDRLMETGSPPITTGTFTAGEATMTSPMEMGPLAPFVTAPRRTVLDKLLLDAALEAGAEVREGFYLEGLVEQDGAVKGIVGRTDRDSNITETARIVIGADGRHSRVADLAGAPYLEFHDPLGCVYYGYWNGDLPQSALFVLEDDRSLITFPTHDANVVIAVWPLDRFGEIKKRPAEHILEAYRDIPGVAASLGAATLTEKVLGSADLPSFVRKSWGPGWTLVGDAAYHKDPTPADGINDAFRGAELLAKVIDDAFSGRRSMEDALEEYETQRAASTSRSLPPTLLISSFEETPMDKANAFMDLAMWRADDLATVSAEATT